MSLPAGGSGRSEPVGGLPRTLIARITIAALLLACLAVPAAQGRSHPRHRHGRARPAAPAVTLPPQGIFESCSLDGQLDACIARLSVIHSAGLSVVVITAGGSLSAMAQYAQAAQSLGMSVMWELSNPVWWREPASGTGAAGAFPAFASGCGCQDNGDVLAFAVQWLASQPGTYGYYAADDSMLAPGDEAGVADYVARIKQRDPAHPVMIGAFQADQRRQYVGVADLVGQEIYPITTDRLLPQDQHPDMWAYVDATVQGTQQDARAAGKGTAFILQAFTWGDNLADGTAVGVCGPGDSTESCNARLRYPGAAEQRALRNAVIARTHPQLILWWSFQGTYGLAAPDSYFANPAPDEAAARWAGLSTAISSAMPAELSQRQRALRNRARVRARRRAALRLRRRG